MGLCPFREIAVGRTQNLELVACSAGCELNVNGKCAFAVMAEKAAVDMAQAVPARPVQAQTFSGLNYR